MSVLLKSQYEIRSMAGGLIHYLDLYRDILAESTTYAGFRGRAGGGEGGKREALFICWLLYRVWVANKVAYAVHCGCPVNLREDLPDVIPYRADLRELAADLRSLHYNIYTNGGQYWLDDEWHRLFLSIAERIRSVSELACAGGAR